MFAPRNSSPPMSYFTHHHDDLAAYQVNNLYFITKFTYSVSIFTDLKIKKLQLRNVFIVKVKINEQNNRQKYDNDLKRLLFSLRIVQIIQCSMSLTFTINELEISIKSP